MGSIPVAGAKERGMHCIPLSLAPVIGMRNYMQASGKLENDTALGEACSFQPYG